MKTKTKIITGLGLSGLALIGYFIGKPTRSILSKLQIRVDSQGNGNYGSSRVPPYNQHKGLDLVAIPGEKVYAPFAGTAVFIENAYQANNKTFQGVKLFTENNLEVDILYINPVIKTNDIVKKGQLIGFAQNITLAHNAGMLPHIHVEHKDRRTNQFIDPTNYYFPNNIARTGLVDTTIENPSQT
jgi:murein DD-endopeptidase MepM/ murein hydrolase activator NlpD